MRNIFKNIKVEKTVKKRNFVGENNSSFINNNEFYKCHRTSHAERWIWERELCVKEKLKYTHNLTFAWKLWKSCFKSQPRSSTLYSSTTWSFPSGTEVRLLQDNIWISWVCVKSFLIHASSLRAGAYRVSRHGTRVRICQFVISR